MPPSPCPISHLITSSCPSLQAKTLPLSPVIIAAVSSLIAIQLLLDHDNRRYAFHVDPYALFPCCLLYTSDAADE